MKRRNGPEVAGERSLSDYLPGLMGKIHLILVGHTAEVLRKGDFSDGKGSRAAIASNSQFEIWRRIDATQDVNTKVEINRDTLGLDPPYIRATEETFVEGESAGVRQYRAGRYSENTMSLHEVANCVRFARALQEADSMPSH